MTTVYEYISSVLKGDESLMEMGDVFPDYIPQDTTFPAMMFQITSAVPLTSKEGISWIDSVRVSIHFLADSSVTVDNMAIRVRVLLEGNRDLVNHIDGIEWVDMEKGFDPDVEMHYRVDDYLIRITR
mgnify:FL=1